MLRKAMLIAAMSFAVAACDGSKTEEKPTGEASTSSTTTTTTTTTTTASADVAEPTAAASSATMAAATTAPATEKPAASTAPAASAAPAAAPTPGKDNGKAISTDAKTTTASGLKYTIMQMGKKDAKEAKSGDAVSVHYTGWLPEGKKFDSSLDRNAPFEFTLGQGMVIKGWDEGVVGMKVGGRRRLVMGSALGYGARGQGAIPPNATLVFVVELKTLQ